MKKEIHFPTILGLLFLIIAIAAGVYLTGKTAMFGSKANSDCSPQNLQLSNITADSFNLFFITDSKCGAVVNLDNRTFSDLQPTESRLHYFLIENLEQSTNYPFVIISGGQNYDSSSYNLKTAAKPNLPIPSSDLAWGEVMTADNYPAVGSVVFINIPGASTLSAQVTSDGKWNIPLSTSFDASLEAWFVPPQDSSEDLIIFGLDGLATQVTGNTSLNNPVPVIILGQSDFSEPELMLNTGDLPSIPNRPSTKSLQIINPADNEEITTTRPDFFGSAPIGSVLDIKVESPLTINDTISVESDGSWNWSPPQNLSPGDHTITVSTTNPATGLVETISRSFTVLAADNNNLAFTASGSATPILPTSAPTIFSTPTPEPTVMPSPSTYVRPARPSTTSAVPVTADTVPTFILMLSAIIFMVISLLFFRKSDNFN